MLSLHARRACRFTLHIVDLDPNSSSANGWLEDVSKVEKYEISEEAYNAREHTYRKFKEQKLKEVCVTKHKPVATFRLLFSFLASSH